LFADRHIVDTRVSNTHQAVMIELPEFVAIAAKPIAFIIVPFVAKANGYPAFAKIPQLLDEPVLQFLPPFARQEFDYRGTTL
jgi:hypothetical protein